MNSNPIHHGAIRLDRIQPGSYYIQVPEAGLRLLAGTPPDSIKHLRALGFVSQQTLDGVVCETGPNAILLGEKLAQKGEIANLSEFPVLHMLYKQGLGIPGHPGQKRFGRPKLIGQPKDLAAQAEYIKRGNYGLYRAEEYEELQLPPDEGKLYLDLKRQFAYGRFVETGDLMELLVLEEALELGGGVRLKRLGENRFEVIFGEESVTLDLNLQKGEAFLPSYQMPPSQVPQAKFAVVHIGDGDGWDHRRPCLSSLLVYKNRKYLVDAGPFVWRNLKNLGLKPTEIEGMFLTHVHDDHFGGFYALLKKHPNLKVFATPRIFLSLLKKYSALTGQNEGRLRAKIAFEPLIPGKWNSIGGLEAKALPSAHPIDTTLFLFRAKGPEGYKTYGHLTDIASRKVLETFAQAAPDPEAFGRFARALLEVYDQPLDLKRVDVGGGFVHGEAEDFAADQSGQLLLSHTSEPLDPQAFPFGVQPKFGEYHLLIP